MSTPTTAATLEKVKADIQRAEQDKREAQQPLLEAQERLEIIRENPGRSTNAAEEASVLREWISVCEGRIQACQEFAAKAAFLLEWLPRFESDQETMAEVHARHFAAVPDDDDAADLNLFAEEQRLRREAAGDE